MIEVGVFRGVTTLAMALQLPEDGIIRGLDVSREFAEVGFQAWEKAGVSKKIDFIEGPALESMQALLDRGEAGSYNLIFIDANKDQYPEYYELSLQLLRQGGVVVMDNTLLHGLALAEHGNDGRLPNLGKANELIKNDKRVAAVMTSLADGVYFARKLRVVRPTSTPHHRAAGPAPPAPPGTLFKPHALLRQRSPPNFLSYPQPPPRGHAAPQPNERPRFTVETRERLAACPASFSCFSNVLCYRL